MALSEALLPEFEHEMANTRRTLERVPEAKLAWKPHDKSMTMGELAVHLATIRSWVMPTIHGAGHYCFLIFDCFSHTTGGLWSDELAVVLVSASYRAP